MIADTAIQIVHLPCRGVHLHMHVITYHLILVTLQAGVGRGWTPRNYPQITFSNRGVDYLSLTPLESDWFNEMD